MKKLFLIVGFLITTFSFAQNWKTDFSEAKTEAAKEHKPIILVFQGSDWCAPCMKLEREIWSTEAFKSYAESHFIMLKADFPRRKNNALTEAQQIKNNQLAEKYNKNGYFPFVVVLDEAGNVLGETGYKRTSPEEYIKMLEAFKS